MYILYMFLLMQFDENQWRTKRKNLTQIKNKFIINLILITYIVVFVYFNLHFIRIYIFREKNRCPYLLLLIFNLLGKLVLSRTSFSGKRKNYNLNYTDQSLSLFSFLSNYIYIIYLIFILD